MDPGHLTSYRIKDNRRSGIEVLVTTSSKVVRQRNGREDVEVLWVAPTDFFC